MKPLTPRTPRLPAHLRRVAVGLLGLCVAVPMSLAFSSPDAHASSTPQPVYAPHVRDGFPDPGLVRDGNQYYLYGTGGEGGLGQVATAKNPQGPWAPLGTAISRWPAWASGAGAIWAPDAHLTSAGWVLYFAAQAKGFAGQRCIGAALATAAGGPFVPLDRPLVCPKATLGGDDLAPGRPDPTSGVIDPSPFTDSDGSRYLLYKTQKTPGTIRMVQITEDGLHAVGMSRELVRHADSIENPALVKRGDQYILFASANWFDQCAYSTVWRRSTDIWAFADKEEHTLMDQANTGVCGPGGADIVTSPGGPTRMVFHGWVCDEANTPCSSPAAGGPVSDPRKIRVVYAAVIDWGSDGATPTLQKIMRPVG